MPRLVRSARFATRPPRAAFLLPLLASLLLPAAVQAAPSSPDPVWSEVPGTYAPAVVGERDDSRIFRLNHGALEGILAQAPLEIAEAPIASTTTLAIPMPDGTLQRFAIEESPIMEPELAAQLPGVNTFRARGIDDPALYARFDRTPLGFHAIVLGLDGAVFVNPISLGNVDDYVSYQLAPEAMPAFECLVDGFVSEGRGPAGVAPGIEPVASGATRRSYRLAVAASGEYTQYFGSAANALAGIVTTMNSVNAVYNREIAVQLNLIGNDNLIVYTDPSTDPFIFADKNAETQAAIDGAIGDGNYDIGHLFHKAGSSISGNAGCIGCVCSSGAKGSGWSQGPNPDNSNFVFLVCHEMGHQHGANHTWNGPGCGGESSPARYEPGSGTTIMSYSSICGSDNIQGSNVGDLYFHAGSRAQIMVYLGGTSCAATSATGNQVPIVNAGSDYTIPRGTPFRLAASAVDLDGDPLTYCWEEYDIGPNVALNAVDQGTIPLFRSFPPVADPVRTFPRFSDLLAGNLFPGTLGEQLPGTNRSMTFRVTARDNAPGIGAAQDDQMVVTVSGDPFSLTYPNGGESVAAGAPLTVTWNVGGGAVAPLVNVLYSTDGGANFSTLAAGVANDGSQQVTLPCTTTSQARILVEAVGNIFFDVSANDFSAAPAPPGIASSASGGSVDGSCEYVVTFSGTVTDDGSVAAADVDVAVSLLTGNATLGTPTVNKNQVNATTVTVSGSVLVSDLTGSPATVRVRIDAEDGCGASATKNVDADVADTTPPVIACPDTIVVECTTTGGTPADDPQLIPFFTGASATDNCDSDPGITNDAPSFFPDGQTTEVIFTATDASGNAAACTTSVTVVDTTPPEISVELNRDALWPPNHKMSEITATVTVTDICDPNPTWVLASIVSNEPDNGLGDGDTDNDIQEADFGFEDPTFLLRSERSGGGGGRCYTITFTASDMSGNSADSVLCVRVPHDKGGSAMASSGYLPTGAWVDANATTFTLVVMADPKVDPAAMNRRDVFVGNSQSAMRPVMTQLVDLTGDGRLDLALTYPTSGVQAMRSLASKKDAIGLHYRGDDGTDYLVKDIFDIGIPVHFEEIADGSLGEVGNVDAVDVGDGIEPGAENPAVDVVAPGGAPRPGILSVPAAGHVTVEVFDVRGRRLRVLVDEYLNAGDHVLSWDGRVDTGRPAPSGVYFSRIQGPGLLEARRVVWVR